MLFDTFIFNIKDKHLFTKKDRLLIATSGGVDSVVLCKLCSLAQFNFSIAHCNFQLRGSDADRDEKFVKSLAENLSVTFHSIKFDTKNYAAANRISTQVAARNLRYSWFEQLRIENGYDYILTAHHADDNAETILMSFLRGTGIRGLTGIKEKNGFIVRPLLFARRMQLEDFLHDQQLSFMQDETNLHDEYTRNYIRNTLLPAAAKVYPEVIENLLSNIDKLKDVETLYRQSIVQHKKKLLQMQHDDVYLPVLLLQNTPAAKTVLFEILTEYSFTAAQVQEVMALLTSESGRYITSSTHRVLKDRKHLIISKHREKETNCVVIGGEGKYIFSNGVMEVRTMKKDKMSFIEDAYTACIDASKLDFPLLLRPWKTGDYFYPLGMGKKKKLSRFFIDKKLSLAEKEKVWVIESNKKILWIVGQRIDNRVKITDATQKLLQMVFLPHEE